MPRTVTDWIDRWESTELVGPDLARSLRDDVALAAQGPTDADAPADSTVDRVVAAARAGFVELLGYLGAGLTLGTLLVVLDVPSWSDTAIVGLLAVVAATTGWGSWVLSARREPAAGRLAGVLGFVAVAATAGTLVGLVEPRCDLPPCRGGDDGLRVLVVAAGSLVAAVVVYLRHAHLLTHAALGFATAATVVAVGDLVGGDASEGVVGPLLLVAATAWAVASERDLLRPAWLGTLAAGAVSYGAVALVVDWSLFGGDQGELALAQLALATAWTVSGALTSRLRVVLVGVGGLVWTVPWTATEVLGWSATTTATVLLPVGIALSAWAVVAARRGSATG